MVENGTSETIFIQQKQNGPKFTIVQEQAFEQKGQIIVQTVFK